MKRVLSLLFALVFVIAAFPVTFASAADVIEISDAAQLAAIGTNDNYPLSGSYKLTKSINLSGYDNWTPIGNGSAFSGTFEGNGKTISGLKVNTSGTYAGLFGQVSGTVKNLTVTGSVTLNNTSSSATSVYAGILAGNVSGWLATIDSCSTSGDVTVTSNCTASFAITSANVYAGGVIGNNSSFIGSEILSHKSGTVTASYTGSKATGNVYAGGIAGKTSGSLTDCYNKGDVKASTSKGSSYAGGLAGQCGATETSYNTGAITAGTYCGAIAGYATGSSTNCYYETGSASQGFGGSGMGSTPTATAKKASEMTNKKLSGFNFDDVWESSFISAPNHYTVNEVITGSVGVLGNFQVGEKLTADMSKVTPEKAYNGVIKYVKYQWESGTKDSEGNITYTKISGATGNTYTISASDMGKYIRLVVRGRLTYGGKLESKEGLVSAAVPKNVKVENTDNGIKVTWDKISGASQYTIYRSTYSEGFMGFGAGYNSYTSVGTSTTNSYTDSSVTNGTKYKYKVSVTMNGTESDQSAESAEISAQLPCQHQWDSGKETTKATCEATGVKTYTCSLCKGTRTETIPATGHSYNDGTVTKQATCEEAGKKSFFCSKCWKIVEEDIPAIGHNYDNGVITTERTCEVDGVKTYTCANCKGTKTETIPATGHSFSTSTVTKEPTCTEAGVKTGTCTNCGKLSESYIEPLGHSYPDYYTIDKLNTPTEDGSKSKYCTRCAAQTDVVTIPKLVAPTVTSAKRVNNGIQLNWTSIEGAENYIIYRNDIAGAAYEVVATVSTTSYVDSNVVSGKTYYYAIASVNSTGRSVDLTEFSVKYEIPVVSLDAPTVKITNTAKGIKLTWDKVANAESYRVYRRTYDPSTKKYSAWKTLSKSYEGTSYVDKTVKLGTTYNYIVKGLKDGELGKGKATSNLKYTVTPTVELANTSTGISVKWNKIAGVSNYRVYRSTYNSKTKKWSSWTTLATVKNNVFSYTDKKAKSGTTYRYTVKALNGKIASSNKAVSIVRLATPTVKIANASTGVSVKWNKIAGAKNYRIYRSTYNTKTKKWSSWTTLATVKNNVFSYTDKKVKSGTTYRYTVKALNGKIASSNKAVSILVLSTPKTTVKAVKNGVAVSWTGVTGAKNYEVLRAEYNTKTKKYSGYKKVATAKSSTKKWTDTKAKKGVKYKYAVRAVNGKSVGAYKAVVVSR